MIDKWLTKSKLHKLEENFTKNVFLNRISANQITTLALILGLMSALSIFLSGILIWKIELIICILEITFPIDFIFHNNINIIIVIL